jgi:hypothetical protein
MTQVPPPITPLITVRGDGKNPAAVALGRLGGLAGSVASKRKAQKLSVLARLRNKKLRKS